jgi:membrane-associated protease RseP (regulator of RpoE activity)
MEIIIMNTILWILLIISILVLCAKIAKTFFKKDTTLGFLILLKTNYFSKIIEKLGRKKRFLDFISKAGIIIGFGAFGCDYITKNKKISKINRFLLFILVTTTISFITYFIAGNLFLNNPIIPKFIGYFIIILTGIMGLSGFTLGTLMYSAYDIIAKLFIGQIACPGVGLVIPGVKIPKVDFQVPLYGWIILILSAMIHEFFHGALLKRFKLKIKSVGVILAGVLPLGAFVEPDEKELKKQNKNKVAQMYSAGPTSNFILSIIFIILLLFTNIASSTYITNINNQKDIGIKIIAIEKETNICGSVFENPAYGILKVNDLILNINGKEIKTNSDYKNSLKIDSENKFEVINLDTNISRTEYLKTNELGNIGFTAEIIKNKDFVIPFKYKFIITLISVFSWTALLNFLISAVNFLPTVPFDGGFLSQVIFSRYLNKKNKKEDEKKSMKKVSRFFGIIIIILLILNVIPYFL